MKILTPKLITSYLAAVPDAMKDEPLSGHTTLRIGGKARLFVVAGSADELIAAIEAAKRFSIPWVILGGGSNTLVSDEGYEGVVIMAGNRKIAFDGTRAVAESGAFTTTLARQAADAGLRGFAWGATVPGTVGGAVVGDAGCYGKEMKDVVVEVEAYDPATSKRMMLANTDCRFGYRESRFKAEPFVVLSATLALEAGDAEAAKEEIETLMAKRRMTQPLGEASAGCMFKNFSFEDESVLAILKRRVPNIPPEMLAQKRITAGWLIDRLDLKGTTIGNASVSEMHANFVVVKPGARAQDVIALTSMIKMRVRDDLGILLEDELRLVGW
ncbi:MAG: UDP-N-acetylmuramate dehydrogenase [Patescibacteria group bacterium]